MDRILVVDDDVLILAALSRILQAEGYEVVTHSDPVQAAREQDFHVVLTDFMMPRREIPIFPLIDGAQVRVTYHGDGPEREIIRFEIAASDLPAS